MSTIPSCLFLHILLVCPERFEYTILALQEIQHAPAAIVINKGHDISVLTLRLRTLMVEISPLKAFAVTIFAVRFPKLHTSCLSSEALFLALGLSTGLQMYPCVNELTLHPTYARLQLLLSLLVPGKLFPPIRSATSLTSPHWCTCAW